MLMPRPPAHAVASGSVLTNWRGAHLAPCLDRGKMEMSCRVCHEQVRGKGPGG